MIIHILCYKNILTKSFTSPLFVDIDPETAGVQLSRTLVMTYKKDPKKVLEYEDLVLYHLADFDDQTGLITPISPVILLNCFDVVQEIKYKFNQVQPDEKKETETDGKSSIDN